MKKPVKPIKSAKVKVSAKAKQATVARSGSSKSKQTVEKTPSQRLDAIGIEAICAYVAGGESLRSWAIINGFANVTVTDWIAADSKRAEHYARAREDRADFVFESLDDVSGAAIVAKNAVQVAGLRLKSDNIKWKLARMNAKKYGDRLNLDAEVKVTDMTDEQVNAKLAEIAAKARGEQKGNGTDA